jgi:glycosyltransferase involved in cell wall biosynthesis
MTASPPLDSPMHAPLPQAGVPGLVSVIIPTYNRAGSLVRAIESALAQTYDSLEIVVVDDGSSDDTRSVVVRYGPRVRYVWQENAGVSAARNTGFRHARGEFVALLDSDDAWQPWKLAAQVAVLRADPSLGMVWTDMSAVTPSGVAVADQYLRTYYGLEGEHAIEAAFPAPEPLSAMWSDAPAALSNVGVRRGDIFSRLILGNCVHTSTVLLRRERLRHIGGFDESLGRSGEDYDFHFHTCFFGPVGFLDTPSTLYQVGADDQLSGGAHTLQIARSNLRTVEKWLKLGGTRIVVPRALLRWRLAESHAWVGEQTLERGDRVTARSYFYRSLRLQPRQPRRAMLLLATFVPVSAIRTLRRLRARARHSRVVHAHSNA